MLTVVLLEVVGPEIISKSDETAYDTFRTAGGQPADRVS